MKCLVTRDANALSKCARGTRLLPALDGLAGVGELGLREEVGAVVVAGNRTARCAPAAKVVRVQRGARKREAAARVTCLLEECAVPALWHVRMRRSVLVCSTSHRLAAGCKGRTFQSQASWRRRLRARGRCRTSHAANGHSRCRRWTPARSRMPQCWHPCPSPAPPPAWRPPPAPCGCP